MIGDLISAGMSLFGGMKAQKSQEKMAEKNIQLQKDFAQQGVQWKVADAKAAGIHPLFALGANTHSFAPVSIGDSVSSSFANAGQDIGRAVNAVSDGSTRVKGIALALQNLQLERANLENDLLRSQIRKNNSAGTPPPVPTPGTQWLIPGQGNTTIPAVPGTIVDEPLERSGVDPTRGYSESGALASVGYEQTRPGYYMPIPSKDVKNRIEDTPYDKLHFIRSWFGGMDLQQPPPHFRNGRGQIISFNPLWGYHMRPDPRYRGTTAGRFSPGRKLWRD